MLEFRFLIEMIENRNNFFKICSFFKVFQNLKELFVSNRCRTHFIYSSKNWAKCLWYLLIRMCWLNYRYWDGTDKGISQILKRSFFQSQNMSLQYCENYFSRSPIKVILEANLKEFPNALSRKFKSPSFHLWKKLSNGLLIY